MGINSPNKLLACFVIITTVYISPCNPDLTVSAAFSAALASALITGSSLATKSIVSLAQSAPTARSCAIEIRNYHKDLEFVDPDDFVERGVTQLPPSPVISPGYKEACMYRKTQGPATGSYGVLTYKIHKISQKDGTTISDFDGSTLFLMWGVPWAWEWNSNYQAIGIWKPSPPVDYNLFDKMYYKDGDFIRKEGGKTIVYDKILYGTIKVKITATMNDESLATWIINIK